MLKVVRFLELMWLVIGIISAVIASYHLYKTTVQDALFFYFLSAAAVGLFFLRRKHRKKLEKDMKTSNHKT